MPEAHVTLPTPEQQQLDRQLLLSMLLPVAAAGVSTIVGYTVAHWTTLTASKAASCLVSAAALVLCACSALLAARARRQLGDGDDTQTEHGRRLFMAKLGLLLSGISTIVVVAGILVLVILRPND